MYDTVAARVKELATEPVTAAYQIIVKQDRVEALSAARKTVMTALEAEELDLEIGAGVFKKVEKDIVRGSIIKTGQRIDGRDTKTVRQINCEVGVLPRAHGSALFTRGETQALVVTTLGTGQDEQIIDALEGEYREAFMLHYNFPPYSVGEASFLRSPGRREIGHGKLAWRAVRPLLPNQGRLSLHDACCLGGHGIERIVLDGDGLWVVDVLDGRRCAARQSSRRHRHGFDQGSR